MVREDFSDKVRLKHITEGGNGVNLGSKEQQSMGFEVEMYLACFWDSRKAIVVEAESKKESVEVGLEI